MRYDKAILKPSMNRRDFLVRMAALPSLFGATGERPNILYIMADDHASHAISAYGSRINHTPNIDRIAKEGMRFDNCFFWPISIMTGL